MHASVALITYHLGLSTGCLFLLPGGKLFAEGDLIYWVLVLVKLIVCLLLSSPHLPGKSLWPN